MNSSQRQILNPYQRLRPGCYALRYQSHKPYEGPDANPAAPEDDDEYAFEGTLRVVHYTNEGNRALPITNATPPDPAQSGDQEPAEPGSFGQVVYLSGDLYATDSSRFGAPPREIPIYPRNAYRFYLLATDIRETAFGEFDLYLRSWEYVGRDWVDRGEVVARLAWTPSPDGSPSLFDYLTGTVRDAFGEELGVLSLNWISPYLRRAVIEFDRVSQVQLPLDNHSGNNFKLPKEKHRNWQDVFRSCGWHVVHCISDQPADPASKTWSEAELQQALPALRDTFDLDHEWRYHVFCVGHLEDGGRGYKFDLQDIDGRENPLESVIIAARFQFPENARDPALGRLMGRALEETPAYFRTCVHEIGHALKLDHNFETNGYMATTDAILQEHENRRNPDETGRDRGWMQGDGMDLADWEFAEGDLQRLRHWPDIVVRPGGGARKLDLPGIDAFRMVPLFGGQNGSKRAPNLLFEASPHATRVPLGAPVRIHLQVRNLGLRITSTPALRLKSGQVTGSVVGPDGQERSFVPLAETLDATSTSPFPRNATTRGSLTLLRGPDGPLFPTPGTYQVRVELRVFLRRRYYLFNASTEVMITPFEDDRHRRIATLLLDTRQALLSLAVGGDGLTEGNQAINLALSHPILSPYFQIVRLKRLVRGIGRVRGYLGEVLSTLCTSGAQAPVLTSSELVGLVRTIRPQQSRDDRDEALENNLVPTPYLIADLRQVAVRIVLGQLQDKTLETFLDLIRTKTREAAGPQQRRSGKTPAAVPQAMARTILEGLLKSQVGLSRSDSRELSELLCAGEDSVWNAVRLELENSSEENRERIRSAASRVGLPITGLTAAVSRFQQAAEDHPDRFSTSELQEFSEELLASLQDSPLHSKPLNDVFRENLEANLREAGLLPAPRAPKA